MKTTTQNIRFDSSHPPSTKRAGPSVTLSAVLALSLAALFLGTNSAAAGERGEFSRHNWDRGNRRQSDEFLTTVAYVEQFYPLWFTYEQSLLATTIDATNRLVGPETISPIYQTVVAINDDTLYASSFLDLSHEPVILTIPHTTVTYSILNLDPYGSISATNIVAGTPGTNALIGPGWSGLLPAGVTPIMMPLNASALLFRADRHSGPTNMTAEAREFRKTLRLATLSDYNIDPTTNATAVVPEYVFATPFKLAANALVAVAPIEFLKQLQKAVASPRTPPFSPYEQILSDAFDNFFGDGEFNRPSERRDFADGTRAAHAEIVHSYLSHTDRHGWINFTNIGDWGDRVIERSAITEYIQYGNGHQTAAYYHTFTDEKGAALNGNDPKGYALTFPANDLPQAKRFWSVTAYTPDAIELVPNPAEKYLVASYTRGLETNADGSISIYMSQELPAGVPKANWLPVPPGPFNIMLRFYGPEGKVAAATYLPPAIRRSRRNHN